MRFATGHRAMKLCSFALSLALRWEVVDALQENSARGNPVCWQDGFTFALCCGQETEVQSQCWNDFFTYDTCCLDRYEPTPKCRAAANAEEQLWHCRMRPHWQTQRCFEVSVDPVERNKQPKTLYSGNYTQYQELQQEKSTREIAFQFISERVSEVVALYIARQRTHDEVSGLCHGAKTGAEVRFLRQALKQYSISTKILGTDITPEASQASHGDVVKLDFHQPVVEWLQSWDFVYSNTLDHSYDPLKALRTWRAQLRSSESLLILQHSELHQSFAMDSVDIYGGSLGEYCPVTEPNQVRLGASFEPLKQGTLLKRADFEIVDLIRLPEIEGKSLHEDLIFAKPKR